ncbi:glycogen debranching N-terminal domain-containing protein (plasmid) [Haladaptatus sp. SPP-AMP-3]|uniref:MGH1-like glycoside hydrolase domain-containing protein n=1 Tax=Haladaptatus sp. SPP-AMP-3 TaxID=3121295 RepID=UPI003C2FE1CA
MLPDDCALAVDSGRQVIVDSRGDVTPRTPETGVYESDHRYLSTLEIEVGDGGEWTVLGREVRDRGVTTTLASPTVGTGRGDQRPWTLEKRVELTEMGVTATARLTNNTADTRETTVAFELAPDFGHVFDIPSFFSPRERQDRTVSVERHPNGCAFVGTLADGTERRVTVSSDTSIETAVTDGSATISTDVTVAPASTRTVELDIDLPAGARNTPEIDADIDCPRYGRLIDRAAETLGGLMLPCGVPAAGAPRFLAPFGRDSLLVSYQLLPFDSSVAERTLRFLADEQGTETDDATLEAPGRIMHEKRHGDLPAIGESVRTPYYGTVDATPLFAALFADTVAETEDETLFDSVYPHAKSAVEWTLAELDDEGFLFYEPHDHPLGLAHLGWKDSAEALARPDGTPARGAVALAEVQGYVFRALTRFAPLAERADDSTLAAECEDAAETLAEAFEERLWLPEEGCYALGIDDRGVIPSVASNQGHAIWGGLGSDRRVARVATRLTDDDMLTSAGVRTFASSHDSFDPLSYHRGSVWPHDTSIAAMGFAERGHHETAETLAVRGLDALADTVRTDFPDRFGFPELMVGFDGDVSAGTVRHPDACIPAAWSAGSVFGFLQSVESNRETADAIAELVR